MSFKPVSAESYPAGLRCYNFAARKAVHLKSTARFGSLNDIRDAVQHESNSLSLAAFLFVSQAHLPPDLHAQIRGLPGFSMFCRYIAFAPKIYEVKLNLFTYPSSIQEHNQCTPTPIAGFPVTAPSADRDVVTSCAHSLGITETKAFLGNFLEYAGRMMFLNLNFSSEAYRPAVADFLAILSSPFNR